jgi:hypothetical protein
VGMKRHGENQWGDGVELREKSMWKEEDDWVKVVWDGRTKRIERGDWQRGNWTCRKVMGAWEEHEL